MLLSRRKQRKGSGNEVDKIYILELTRKGQEYFKNILTCGITTWRKLVRHSAIYETLDGTKVTQFH